MRNRRCGKETTTELQLSPSDQLRQETKKKKTLEEEKESSVPEDKKDILSPLLLSCHVLCCG